MARSSSSGDGSSVIEGADRRNGTQPVGWYREFAPCEALRADVYALFSFVPEPHNASANRTLLREVAFHSATVCSPQLADAHVSLVFELPRVWSTDRYWRIDSSALRGTVIGPKTVVGRVTESNLPEMIGVLFRPARADRFLRVTLAGLTDTAVSIGDLWGSAGDRLARELCELDERARIERLETMLLARLAVGRHPTASIDLEGLAADVRRRRGRGSVNTMARDAGVSRQHLSRLFRERLGVGPKLYSRLARFQAGLVYAGAATGAGCQPTVDWAQAAAGMGYADQSHMIAEFRRFGGLTPRALAARDWFHPFIDRAKARRYHSVRR